MRRLALVIAILAAAKLGYQEYIYRGAVTETLLTAYRQDAIESCRKEAARRNLSVSYVSWEKPAEVGLVVGKSAPGAGMMRFAEALMSPDASVPYIVITARKQPFQILCEFDLVRLAANVYRM